MPLERRHSPRTPFFETVSIQKPDRDAVAHGHSLELSAQGIGLCSDIPLQPRKQCRIALDLEGQGETHKVSILCESRNCSVTEDYRGYRVGLRFLEVSVGEAALIGGRIQHELNQV